MEDKALLTEYIEQAKEACRDQIWKDFYEELPERLREEYEETLWDGFYEYLTDEIFDQAPEGKGQQELDLFLEAIEDWEHEGSGFSYRGDYFYHEMQTWLSISSAEKLAAEMIEDAKLTANEWYSTHRGDYLEQKKLELEKKRFYEES